MNSTDYESLFPRFSLQIQPCPRVVVLDAMQLVGMDFFTRAGCWRETLVASVFRHDRFACVPVERNACFVRVVSCHLDGNQLEAERQFTIHQAGEGATLELAFEPDQDRTAYVLAVLRPSRTSMGIPAQFAEEWGDVLVYGTLAKLKSMSGPQVGFTDPQGAALNLQLYEDGIARAKVLVARGRYDRCDRYDRYDRCDRYDRYDRCDRDGRRLFAGGRKP